MLYAIFENGGKQFKAAEGNYIEVDHISQQVGKKISFDKVLLLVNDSDTQIGSPYIKGASIDATIVDHFRSKKIVVFKYRPKQRYRVKTGHRQIYTRLLVDSIAFSGKSTVKKTVETEKKVAEKKPSAKKRTPAKKAASSKTSKTTSAKPSTSVKKAPAVSKKTSAEKKPVEKPSTRKSIKVLELGSRYENAFEEAGIKTVGQLLKLMEKGNDAVLAIPGIGEKALTDIEKNLKKMGYDISKVKK